MTFQLHALSIMILESWVDLRRIIFILFFLLSILIQVKRNKYASLEIFIRCVGDTFNASLVTMHHVPPSQVKTWPLWRVVVVSIPDFSVVMKSAHIQCIASTCVRATISCHEGLTMSYSGEGWVWGNFIGKKNLSATESTLLQEDHNWKHKSAVDE